jgi:flagellar hook assembly protein FlgD
MNEFFNWLSSGLLIAILCGCSPAAKLQSAKVSGSVTLDDQPLPEGVIVFTKDGEIPKELPIAQGRYEGNVYAGKNHIQFAVYREQRQRSATGPGADQPSLMNILPSKYNQESTESREVIVNGENHFDFALNSK